MRMQIQGAKNAILPAIFAALTKTNRTIIHHAPTDLLDVQSVIYYLNAAGAELTIDKNQSLSINRQTLNLRALPMQFYLETRYSLLTIPLAYIMQVPLNLPYPGGCSLRRKHDIHLDLYRFLGCSVVDDGSMIRFAPPAIESGSLPRRNFRFHTPSVGATISAILATSKPMEATFDNVAVEPEVRFIMEMCSAGGSYLEFDGRSCIVVPKKSWLISSNTISSVNCPSDRIAAMTSVVCAILAGMPKSTLLNFPLDLCTSELKILSSNLSNVTFSYLDGTLRINVGGRVNCKPHVELTATPYPGLASDTMPLLTLLFALLGAEVGVQDNVYGDRFTYLDRLREHGIESSVVGTGRSIKYTPPEARPITKVNVSDLRGGMVAAILEAYHGLHDTLDPKTLSQIARGYEKPDLLLNTLRTGRYA